MSNYELMVIFTPVLSEEDFKSTQKKYQDFIKENGGSTVASNPWGLKSLAYPIDKKTTGIYWILEFTAPATVNEKLKIQFFLYFQIFQHDLHLNYSQNSNFQTLLHHSHGANMP